jgi:P-type Cu+ transporter
MGLFSRKHKDPVCGMTVPDGKQAASMEHNGKTYHFCSAECHARFKADPAHFV